MRKNRKQPPALVDVSLSIVLPDAASVCLAGTFNDWNPAAMPLRSDSAHLWAGKLRLEPGRYEYRIVADGVWIDVPGARETVANPFGSRNAVLTVAALSR